MTGGEKNRNWNIISFDPGSAEKERKLSFSNWQRIITRYYNNLHLDVDVGTFTNSFVSMTTVGLKVSIIVYHLYAYIYIAIRYMTTNRVNIIMYRFKSLF